MKCEIFQSQATLKFFSHDLLSFLLFPKFISALQYCFLSSFLLPPISTPLFPLFPSTINSSHPSFPHFFLQHQLLSSLLLSSTWTSRKGGTAEAQRRAGEINCCCDNVFESQFTRRLRESPADREPAGVSDARFLPFVDHEGGRK